MPSDKIRFGEFELDPDAFELRRAGRIVRMERIPLELLLFLASRRGQLVTREEILEHIWGKDVFVDVDNSINTAVRKLRAALKENPENPRFLRTVPGKGYRFTAEFPADGALSAHSSASGPELTPIAQATASSAPQRHSVFWVSLAIVMVVAALAAGPRLFRPAETVATPKTKLVVLPFLNLGHDPAQEYFADGMTEEIITQLGALAPQKLGVIARTSSMHYKGTSKDAARIATELGVDYLLEGSVRHEGDRVRVSAQLIQANDQTHVWAADFDRNGSDVLKLQSDLALAISNKIALALAPQVRLRLAEAPSVNVDAYQAYLSGLQAWSTRTNSGATRAIADYQRAIVLDPGYAPPYAALATVYSLASVVGVMSTQEAMPKAKQAALRAISLDDSLAAGHTALAFVAAHFDFDWPVAEREFRRALELNPNDPSAHFFFSNSFLSPMGRHEEAIAEMKRALDLDPFSPPTQSFFGQTLLWARKYDEALAQFKKCSEMFPGFAIDHERMAHLYTYLDRFNDAITEDTTAKVLAGMAPETAVQQENALRKAFAAEGPRGYWRKLLEFSQLPGNPPESYSGPQHLAIIYTRLGERETALSFLKKAYDARVLGLTELAVEPAFAPLHSEPEFQYLVRRLGLPLDQ